MLSSRLFPLKKHFYCGEKATFELSLPDDRPGEARLRTNIGQAVVRRRELMREAAEDAAPSGLDWVDYPMNKTAPGTYRLTLPLLETGVFEAKCCFFPADGSRVLWPDVPNWHLKVESAASACGNTIYCAFVRQFAPGMEQAFLPDLSPEAQQLSSQYTIIPGSGTFRYLAKHLDHIFKVLNCRILQLLPVHPVPVQYGRMGVFGSPFAALDYFSVDPALAEFDESATPLEQFEELITAVHQAGGRIFMDIPVNHTGWGSRTMIEHPEYFVRDNSGRFHSPGAWGVVWQDLCQFNFHCEELRDLLAEVFLFWCRRQVDGFRCDAGYKVPERIWQYVINRVRQEFPDTVFLLEGLGGPPDVQEQLLTDCGLDWAYSELFQNYDRSAIERYFPEMYRLSREAGELLSFAETHDNCRLASGGRVYARLRFLVTGLLSCGGFGFANGAEFFATQKIDVHGRGGLNFGAEDNLTGLIGKINLLHSYHPAFGSDSQLELIEKLTGNVIAAYRSSPGGSLLVLLNLDCGKSSAVNFYHPGIPGTAGRDLLTGEMRTLFRTPDGFVLELPPGDGVCLSFDDFDLDQLPAQRRGGELAASAMAMRCAAKYHPLSGCIEFSGAELLQDALGFARKISGRKIAPVAVFRLENDLHRELPLTGDELLLITAKEPFRVMIEDEHHRVLANAASLSGSGQELVMLALESNNSDQARKLQLIFPELRKTGRVVQYPERTPEKLRQVCTSRQALDEKYAFAADAAGGYSLVSGRWGEVNSKYEALLAVNPDRELPTDRRVLFPCCQIYWVCNDFSQRFSADNTVKFTSGNGLSEWVFELPSGQGELSKIALTLTHAGNSGDIRLEFRHQGGLPGKLILRPELEDRLNHHLTRAYLGAETDLPASVKIKKSGFAFVRRDLTVHFDLPGADWHPQGEWHYMGYLPFEEKYGQEHLTDRYSPGYFQIRLAPGERAVLSAGVSPESAVFPEYRSPEEEKSISSLLPEALSQFIVRRNHLKSVIAGFPWFLDWGRDTLIFLRGLLVYPEFLPQCREILLEFAGFEHEGLIPNVIRGKDISNCDTSDAPLYLILGFRDYIARSGDAEILDAPLKGHKNVRAALISIVENYISGTPNGIVMDKTSALVFSPAHFSWMDTNFPAGTPRSGYPVEIQSLWFSALEFLGYQQLADQVKESIRCSYFSCGRLCDCLHADSAVPAHLAQPDDHLRPNILWAITSKAVEDTAVCQRILEAVRQLLVPGGIRTLDDVRVEYPLDIRYNGETLNDPHHPYKGEYRGPEDTGRKPAYHNGTVWLWPFPAYCEALYLAGGEKERKKALDLLLGMKKYWESGAVGQLPEVADGDAPHCAGGCAAQAWSVSEFARVYALLG